MRMRDQGDSARRLIGSLGRKYVRVIDDDFDLARGTVDQQPLGPPGHIRNRSTMRPWTRCSSMISSMSDWSTYVYQTASGYTTTHGPSSQRSRQPALLTRTLPGPASFSSLMRLLQYARMSSAL